MSDKRKTIDLLNTDLYAITGEEFSRGRTTVEVVGQLIAAGIRVIQYREKEKPLRVVYDECLAVRRLTAENGCCLIIDDYVDVAMAVGADGVHIGQDDMPFDVVRRLVGPDMIIGLSTHSPEQVAAAVAAHADYVGVGPIYSTHTKKNVCAPVGLTYLDYVRKTYPTLPHVAIGGIKEHNIAEVVRHGARCICLVTDILGADDIVAKVRTLEAIIKSEREKCPQC